MTVVKRLVGLLVVLLGAVGLVACLAGVVGTWVVRTRADTMIARIAERVDEGLTKVQERSRQANERIANTRDAADRLNERVQQRVAQLRGVPTEEAPDIDEIERQLYARLQLAGGWIGFVQSGVDLVEQALQMLDSTSLFLQQETKTRADVIAAVRAGHAEIRAALKLSEDVRIHLDDIRAHRNLDESAKKIRTLSSGIDASLVNVQRFGMDFESAIAQLGTDAKNLGARIRRQLFIIAVVATLMLIWFAAAQASLAVHGWRLFAFAKNDRGTTVPGEE